MLRTFRLSVGRDSRMTLHGIENEVVNLAKGEVQGAPVGVPELEPFELGELVAQSGPLTPENLPKLLTRGIRKRRSQAIAGYIGLNGSFKTWSMIRDTLPSIAMGRKVLSTVTIFDPESGNPHPSFTPFESWSQLFNIENGEILMDEITGIMDSRDQGLPRPVRRYMPQLRRAGTTVKWTGIDWDNSERRLRQLSWAVTKCRGHLPNHKLVRERQKLDPTVSDMWAPNRLAFLTTYDASSLMQSEDSKQLNFELGGNSNIKARRARVLVREWAWAPRSLTFDCYDTLDSVYAVDNLCRHGLDVPKPGLCKDPECFLLHRQSMSGAVAES